MPRKLGQHFLKPASVERLLGVIDPKPGERFLEIGAGEGALTFPLAARCRELVAVELDRRLIAKLEKRRPANVRIVAGDALRLELAALATPGTRLAGNLPYYISSPLLRSFLELRDRLVDLHVMVQLEVAERIAAPPGSKSYGILSVLYGLFAEVDIALRLPPGCFAPPPRVTSAVLRARLRAEPLAAIPRLDRFRHFLETAFARRRRTLENNLQDSYPNLKEHLRLLDIEGSRRPETLSVVEFARLAMALERA